MDILAARKKAAELAKAAREGGRKERAEPVPSLPPVPDTTFVPDALLPDVPQAPAGRAEQEAAPGAPAPSAPETAASGPAAAQDQPPAAAEGEAPPEQPPVRGPELPQEQELEMLAFLLGMEEYVVPVDRVKEVLTPREVTPVPHTPAYLLGVCSLRGVVLPIVDLRQRLGLGAAVRDEKSRIVVVSLGSDDTVGLAVDRVRGVVRLAPSAVRPAPETVEQGGEFLQGIARAGDRLLILLDLEKAVGLAVQAGAEK